MISGLQKLTTSNQSSPQGPDEYAKYFNKFTNELRNKLIDLCSNKTTIHEKFDNFSELRNSAKTPKDFTIDVKEGKSYFGNNTSVVFKIENQVVTTHDLTANEAMEIKARLGVQELLNNSHPDVTNILGLSAGELFDAELKVNHIKSK